MSNWAILGIIVAVAIFLMIVFYLIIGEFFYKMSVKRKAIVGDIVLDYINKNAKKYKIDRKWWDGQTVEKLNIDNGKEKLVGFLVKSEKPSNKFAILVHGYYVSHKDMNAQADIFLKNDFNVFAPDLRSHGESSGKIISMGYYDKDDVILWIKKLIEIYGKNIEIVLYGISMGGATVCMASGEDLPKNVKCVISDCAYDNAYEQFRYILKEKIKLSDFVILDMASRFIKIKGKYDLKKIDPKSAVEKSKLPILFIHGTTDEFVPSYMVKKLYNASNKKKCEIYLVENAGHGESLAKDVEQYENKMMTFTKKHLK